jgi:two-component system response regulator (stage 0 sporulation protein F)
VRRNFDVLQRRIGGNSSRGFKKKMKRRIEILVVDDQPGVRNLLGSIIEEAGGVVYKAKDGLEAVEIVRQVHPCLVFMDVKMPVMNGLEALVKIKAIAPETLVIMMTAYISEEVKKEANEKGALFCLTKPFEVEEIKKILREYRPERPEGEV